jgi:hypothetical protein
MVNAAVFFVLSMASAVRLPFLLHGEGDKSDTLKNGKGKNLLRISVNVLQIARKLSAKPWEPAETGLNETGRRLVPADV